MPAAKGRFKKGIKCGHNNPEEQPGDAPTWESAQDEHDPWGFEVGDLVQIDGKKLKKSLKKRFADGSEEKPDWTDTSKKFLARIKCSYLRKGKQRYGVAWCHPEKDELYKDLVAKGELKPFYVMNGQDNGVDGKIKPASWRDGWNEFLEYTGGPEPFGRGDDCGPKDILMKVKTRTYLMEKEQELAARKKEEATEAYCIQAGQALCINEDTLHGDPKIVGEVTAVEWLDRPEVSVRYGANQGECKEKVSGLTSDPHPAFEWLVMQVDVHAADNRNPGGIRQVNFRDPKELIEVRENKWENALKGLQDQVRAKVELQRETLERTLREKIALKRRLFDEEDFIIRQKVAERDHQIKLLRDKIDTEQLMNNAEKDDILREIQRLEKLQDEAEDDLLRFQIHIEEEIQEMGIKERAQLQFSMMKTLAGDLSREVTRRMRSKDYWHSPDETQAEAEDPSEQALIEIQDLKKQNKEIFTLLQHLTGELKKLREENEVLKSSNMRGGGQSGYQYGGGGGGHGDYMTAGGPTAGGPDDLDPDLDMDINKIIDVQQTRSQALDLVNSLIEADASPSSYQRHGY